MGIESSGENYRAKEQHDDALKEGYHFENLYDQNEDQAGEKINLITGEAIVNDTDDDLKKITIMGIDKKGKLRDVKKDLMDEEATKWLLDNGFDAEGNFINK